MSFVTLHAIAHSLLCVFFIDIVAASYWLLLRLKYASYEYIIWILLKYLNLKAFLAHGKKKVSSTDNQRMSRI